MKTADFDLISNVWEAAGRGVVGTCKAGAQALIRQPALEWSVDPGVIERARILHGWTRRELAQRAHVDEGTLCDLFAGRRRPTFGTLRALCKALGIPFADVIAFAQSHEH